MADSGLLDVTEFFINCNKFAFKLGLFIELRVLTSVIVFDCTLDSKPPPTTYVTVRIVFAGA